MFIGGLTLLSALVHFLMGVQFPDGWFLLYSFALVAMLYAMYGNPIPIQHWRPRFRPRESLLLNFFIAAGSYYLVKFFRPYARQMLIILSIVSFVTYFLVEANPFTNPLGIFVRVIEVALIILLWNEKEV